MQKTWVWSLGQEDPLEKEMATHSSTLAWKIPWTEKPGRLQSMGSQSRTWLSDLLSAQVAATAHKRGWEELPHVWSQGQKPGGPPCPRGGGQEELPHIRGQGQRPRVPGCNSAGTADRSYPASEVSGGSRKELPRVQSQGWQLRVPGCNSTGAAERSYPPSEVRGGGWEELPHVRGQGQRPRVPGWDSAGAAERSSPTSEARGGSREELPPTRGQGQRPGGATPRPRSGVAAERSNPTSKEQWLCQLRRAQRSYSIFKVRGWWWEDTPRPR